uniref:PiggyBac transposable element-derived protein domain-containing protein n=1 Tax=Neogobius melanostomus TaxID=47308 RepID=A0A8C6UL23_9GOBI
MSVHFQAINTDFTMDQTSPPEYAYNDDDDGDSDLDSQSGCENGSPPRRRLCAQSTRWNGIDDLDTAPKLQKFTPKRKPGHQLDPNGTYTPLDLFSLFVDYGAISILCNNINKQAVKSIDKGKKYNWIPVQETDIYKFLGLTFYFCLVKLPEIKDYWKQNTIFSQVFPPKVMARERYRTIYWNIDMSDSYDDPSNDKKKGMPQCDPLLSLRPLLDIITSACKMYYHPQRSLSIEKKMVATKAHIKVKATNKEFQLFVLSDSDNGYTVDFSIYAGTSQLSSNHGLQYDTVMSLLNPSYLGHGYHLYVDNFYTSPRLFKDLYDMNIGACGLFKGNRKDCPQTQNNALTKKEPRGTIRWIREGPLVFVKWMDSREVSICSTFHPAFAGETTMQHSKHNDGNWGSTAVTCPTPVIEYNKHMKCFDFSEHLIQYHTIHQKTSNWYRTLFFHFLDISATNAYLLHKELCRERKQNPMTHRGFVQELTAQLCGVTVSIPPSKAPEQHLPVPVSNQTEKSKRASYGRKGCIYCRNTLRKEQSTPWKCHLSCFFPYNFNQ